MRRSKLIGLLNDAVKLSGQSRIDMLVEIIVQERDDAVLEYLRKGKK